MGSRSSLVACILLSAIPGLSQQATSTRSIGPYSYAMEFEQKR